MELMVIKTATLFQYEPNLDNGKFMILFTMKFTTKLDKFYFPLVAHQRKPYARAILILFV